MLDIKLLRTNMPWVVQNLARRGFVVDAAAFEQLESQRKILQTRLEQLQNERNVRSKAVGVAKSNGQDIRYLSKDLRDLGDVLKSVESDLSTVQADLGHFCLQLPNLLEDSVPDGQSESDNQVVRQWGVPRTFQFPIRDHVDLGAAQGRLDMEAGAKLSGARFVVLRAGIARLHRALAQWMLDLHTGHHGYEEVNIPYLVKLDALEGTGQLPKFKDDQFYSQGPGYHFGLISTAEIPLTNLVREQILDPAVLPLQMVAHSACFRQEAGSYGKDMRGMFRVHQFEKVELVQICKPEESAQRLEQLTHHAEVVLQGLELPYQVVALCAADVSNGAAKTYDLEVWLPALSRYREISSCSQYSDYQARRMKARYRDPSTGQIEYVNTLNGSGVAIGRALIAVLENYQAEDGRIEVPGVLRSYMGNAQWI